MLLPFCFSGVLDGLPTEKVPWEQSIQRRGASNDPAVIGAGGAPKAARILRDPAPEQIAAPFPTKAGGVPVACIAAHHSMRTACGAQACLSGSSVGLPTGSGGQWLALC